MNAPAEMATSCHRGAVGDTGEVVSGLTNSLEALPPGRYLLGVSGGADSTALARLMRAAGREFVVGHLNHQLRGADSDGDEQFVRALAAELAAAAVVGRLSDLRVPPNGNASARYRSGRLAFFRQAVAAHGLNGVVLAHHADDQAETVLLRLIRGARLPALHGMAVRQRVAGVDIFRPLLAARREDFRRYLDSIEAPWREDASNAAADYRRNVVRQWLARQPDLVDPLLALASAARRWRDALHARSPHLPAAFDGDALKLPISLADHAAMRWLIERGAPPDQVSPAARRRLIALACQSTSSPGQAFPGGILVRRRKNRVDAAPAPPARRKGLSSGQSHGKDQAAAAGEF